MARDVLALGKWPFPPLDGVIEAPALRLDGTILHAQGYDAPSRLYLQPDPQLHVPAVPMQPTTQEMSRGKQLIDELLVDFPFDGEASKANAIALLLTPIVRPAIHGQVPLALIDKPAPGTGAGLLVELVAEIATGRSASLTSAPRDEQEWRRTVTALLLHWGMLVIFDNLDETLASGTLAGAITARSWIDRQVSKGTVVEVPQRVTWVATGNNIHLGGDLARRCSLVRMDAKVDRPWDRGGFVHPDLVAWVRSQRSDLLWALLTLARGGVRPGARRVRHRRSAGSRSGERLSAASSSSAVGLGSSETSMRSTVRRPRTRQSGRSFSTDSTSSLAARSSRRPHCCPTSRSAAHSAMPCLRR